MEDVNITAFVAHPDDELMCAGTLARAVDRGHNVRLIVAYFSDFGPDGKKQGLREERTAELRKSAATLGIKREAVLIGDEASLFWGQTAVQLWEPLLLETPCDLLITHYADDANTSHGHLARVAQTVARKNTFTVWELDQAMPGGITDHAPNVFVDISDYGATKYRAIRCYQSQLDRYPGLGSALRARDRMNGWRIGVERAEAFRAVRTVIR